MSATAALDLIIRFFFIVLGIVTVVDYFQRRSPIRRDVAFLFCTLAIPFGVQLLIQIDNRFQSDVSNGLSIICLVLEPYVMPHLVRYLRSVPPRILIWARYALVLVLICIIISKPVAIVALVVYLVGFNLYAMIGFVRGALKATGVARQRLRWAAAGSGLFALILVGIFIVVFFPKSSGIIYLLTQLIAIACALAFDIGFVPPRWLHRTWQLNELRNYLLTAVHNLPSEEKTGVIHSLQRLSVSANQAVNGCSAGVIQYDEAADTWQLRTSTNDPLMTDALTSAQLLIRQAAHIPNATAVYIPDLKDEPLKKQLGALGIGTSLFVPLLINKKLWGMLLVFLQERSLFIDDDLSLLELLTHENAILLTNYRLITELQTYSEQLEHRVEERTTELSQSENRYRELNTQLEERVQERTLQLEAANKELEAFSYSVSHDLRAPLRSINGFSQALAEDYAEQLDDIAKDYLSRIQNSSIKMGELIDDLLEFSRVTRGEINREPVDLSIIVNAVVAELRQQYPQHPVQFTTQDGLMTSGDSRMLRVVLVNLLGNAWKYTTKQTQPVVEFGKAEQDGQSTFYVRDNGAGFDMAYAYKLFGVFQRLHTNQEFPGTGIGLATVQRIINRHGGRVWAEAAVDQGATFYFSI